MGRKLPRPLQEAVGGRGFPQYPCGITPPGEGKSFLPPTTWTGWRDMTVAEALRNGAAQLLTAGIDNPRLEARLLLAHALGCAPIALIRDLTAPVDTDVYDALLSRRASHEPLAYLVGRREFWSLDLAVSPATLIPRPDSETLVEAALAAWNSRPGPCRVLDLGTGTGCLLLAILHDIPGAFGIGVDRAPAAAALAAANAIRIGLADRTAFVAGDWANALDGRFDLIVGNPPYIPTWEIDTLMPEVRRHEPALALDGGADGLTAYRTIIPALPALLANGGTAVLELGLGQDGPVGDLARASGFTTSFRTDLAGIVRAIVLRSAEG